MVGGSLVSHMSCVQGVVVPDWSQSLMLTGKMTGRNGPPTSRPVLAVASALAVNEVMPRAPAR